MSKTLNILLNNIKKSQKKPVIVYAEGANPIIQKAAKMVQKYIEPVLVFEHKRDIPDGLNCRTIAMDNINLSKYANLLYDLRKEKGMTLAEAEKLVLQPNYLCPLIIKSNEADGEICGINYTTKDTLKPALQIIKTDKRYPLVSSVFVMEKREEFVIFSDCAINISPDSKQLAAMSQMACEFAKDILHIRRPKCVLLSYSTNGSGVGEAVDRVREAYNIVKKCKDYDFYGEIQFDAAYDNVVRAKKAKNCLWRTRPNVFMFPNIEAGNIGYKIAQRMGKYNAFGPALVGLAAPVNDLSRGATTQDVVGVSYLTASQVVAKWSRK